MITEELIRDMAAKVIRTDEDLDAVVLDASPKRIQTVNLHHLALASGSDEFARVIREADYVTADGWPIVSLLRARGVEAQRVTGSEFLERMLGSRRFDGMRAGILGATDDVGDDLRLRLHDSGLVVVFRDHGDKATWDPEIIAKELEAEQVQLLIVAVTPPDGDVVGEQVLAAGFEGVVMNIGGAVNMVVGQRSMAPAWARRARVEWLYRLVQEPRRLWHRYLVECVPAFVRYVLPTYLHRSRA